MYRKFICLCLFLFFSTACSSQKDFLSELTKQLEIAEQRAISKPNYYKKHYRYYISASIGRFNSDYYSNELAKDGTHFIITLNVKKYLFKNAEAYISFPKMERKYLNRHKQIEKYYLDYEKLKNGYYLLRFESPEILACSLCHQSEIPSLAKTMLEISRSVEYNDLSLKKEFKEDEAKKFNSSALKLFDASISENGRIQDLFENIKK